MCLQSQCILHGCSTRWERPFCIGTSLEEAGGVKKLSHMQVLSQLVSERRRCIDPM